MTNTSSSESKTKMLYNNEQGSLRIVSLLPSITEVLSSLHVADQIVGITHECDYPPEALENAKVVTTSDINPRLMTQEEIHRAVIGSLKNGHSLYGINEAVLRSVAPQIIFTQQLCDVCAVSYPVVLDTCARVVGGPPPPGWVSLNDQELYPKVISMEPANLNDVLKTFHVAANALGPRAQTRAIEVVSKLELGFEAIRNAVRGRSRPEVAFMEWHNPIFSGGHWIPDMLDIVGASYKMCKSGDRSSPITDEDFIQLDPDFILIGPCGFSLDRAIKDTFKMFHEKPWWREMRAVQEGRVFALDGNSYYARPGPRLLQGCGIMAGCIHGEEVSRILGEELCPTSGFCRITIDMYR